MKRLEVQETVSKILKTDSKKMVGAAGHLPWHQPLTPLDHSKMILDALEGEVTECVRQDWANEPLRREALAARSDARAMRRVGGRCGSKRAAYRRVIWTKTVPGWREFMYHATKGYRSFQLESLI